MRYFILLLFISSPLWAGQFDNYQDFRAHQKLAQVDGHQIAYVDEGHGTPIVLMHGIPTSSWMYRKLIPALANNGYRVIAPDMLGMGSSEKVKDRKKLTVQNQAKILHALLVNKLGLSDWTHVVHDFGGPVTWEMLEYADFKINRLIILNSFAFRDGWNPGLNPFTKFFMSLMNSKPLRKIFYTQAIKSMINAPRKLTDLDGTIEGYVSPMLEGGFLTYKALYFSVNNIKNDLERYQANIRKITPLPSSIIWGEGDTFLTDEAQMPQFQNLLDTQNKNVILLPKGKHIITEDSPEAVLNEILKNTP